MKLCSITGNNYFTKCTICNHKAKPFNATVNKIESFGEKIVYVFNNLIIFHFAGDDVFVYCSIEQETRFFSLYFGWKSIVIISTVIKCVRRITKKCKLNLKFYCESTQNQLAILFFLSH